MQLTLDGGGVPALGTLDDAQRWRLAGGAWVVYRPGWLLGHAEVFEHLQQSIRWRAERRPMYDRIVDVPRLVARLPDDGEGHPVLDEAARVLSARSGRPLTRIALGLYRDGRDSVAWHGDRLPDAAVDPVMALVGLGHPRELLLRPKGGRIVHRLPLGEGDLVVLGGTCQRTWEHAIAKTRKPVGPRIAVAFREAAAGRAP